MLDMRYWGERNFETLEWIGSMLGLILERGLCLEKMRMKNLMTQRIRRRLFIILAYLT